MVDLASLQRYSLFGGIPGPEIELVKHLLGQERFLAGQVIQAEGEPNDRVNFILEGEVAVSRRGALLAKLGEGDTFGEMEFIDIMPSAATIRAERPTTVATITNRAFHEICSLSPGTFSMMVMNLARELSRRLRRMNEIMSGGDAAAVPDGGKETGMARRSVEVPGAATVGPYSQAVESGGFIQLSGQTPIDPATGKLVGGGVAIQASRCLDNLFAVLAAAGLGEKDVVSAKVYLMDMADFAAMNEVYASRFSAPYPARTTIGVAALPLGARVEIELFARRP